MRGSGTRATARAEEAFRKLRRHGLRVRGCAEVEGPVQRDGHGVFLLESLRHLTYARLVCNSVPPLAERLAKVTPVVLHPSKLWTRPSG